MALYLLHGIFNCSLYTTSQTSEITPSYSKITIRLDLVLSSPQKCGSNFNDLPSVFVEIELRLRYPVKKLCGVPRYLDSENSQ